MDNIEERVAKLKSDIGSLGDELERLALKAITPREIAEEGAIYIWHLAYDAGLLDGRGGHYKRPPPSATELAEEAGLLEKVIVEKVQGDP